MKIGLVMPFTYYDSKTAYDALFGARLALREWNAKGGVGGYRIELVALDDQDDGDIAAQRAREVSVDGDILGVIGHLSNEAALMASDEYRRARMPLVTFAAASSLTTLSDNNIVLRLVPNDAQLAWGLLDHLNGRFEIDRVAIIYNPRPGQAEMADAFEREIEKRGGAVVVRDVVDRTERRFSGIERHLNEGKASLVLFLGDYRQAAALGLALQEANTRIVFVVVGSSTPDLLRVGGDKIRSAMYVAPWPLLKSAEEPAKDFFEKYIALAGAEPLTYGPLAYDAANVLLSAAQRGYRGSGKPTREDVLRGLSVLEPIVGISGNLAFDEYGNLKLPKPAVYRIEEAGTYPGVAVE